MNHSAGRRLVLLIVWLLLPSAASTGIASPERFGTLTTRVLDGDTKQPLIAATIQILNTQLGAGTDAQGEISIAPVPVGSYSVKVTYLGYLPIILSDVIVRSQRTTHLEIELTPAPIKGEEVTIRPHYFAQEIAQPVSAVGLSREEIRRTPGSGGDVSRIVMALPSVAKVNDTRNNLVVRGGSPAENGYFVDHIAVPNINHFPLQGTSAGAISLINVDFIEDVRFYSGGFHSAFGDRLSSIMDVSLREGNNQEFDAQIDFSMLGIGGGLEGPLGDRASWMLSARRSYFDLILNSFDVEASTVPEYTDVQTKISIDLSDRHRLALLDIAGFDKSVIDREQARDNKENFHGDATWDANTFGVAWQSLWGSRGYSTTSLSHNYTRWNSHWREVLTDEPLTESASTENQFWLRNTNHFLLSRNHALDCGVEARLIGSHLDNYWAEDIDPLGVVTPESRIDDSFTSVKAGAFASFHRRFNRLSVTPGLRLDHFDYNDHTHVSPRLHLSYAFSPRTSLNGAAGRYSQFLPLILLSQQDTFRDLNDPYADHFVLGISHLMSDAVRLTADAYLKQYDRLPLDPNQPSLFVIDESNDQSGYLSHQELVARGRAESRGIEIMLQKKLADQIYGLISGSISQARYRGYDGAWRNRIYDNRFMCTVEGGYKPNQRWEFGLRWVFAGGAPYTPFDLAASTAANEGILDSERINEERLPDYHSLNLRVDRRFHYRSANLICYLAIWNAYGRTNIAGYYWNEIDNRPDQFEQWGTIPSLGIEFEF